MISQVTINFKRSRVTVTAEENEHGHLVYPRLHGVVPTGETDKSSLKEQCLGAIWIIGSVGLYRECLNSLKL